MSEGNLDYSNQFRVAVERSGKSVPRLDTLLLAMETLGYTSLDKLLGIN